MLHACGIVSFLTPLLTSTAAAAAACSSSEDALPSQEHQCAAPWSATGEVKVTPEDFQVVEIDTSGQRTDADPYAFPHAEALEAASLQTEGVKAVAGEAAEGEGEDANETSAAHTIDDLRCLVADHAPLLRAAFGTAADIGSKAMTSLTPLSMTALLHEVQLSAQGPLPQKDSTASETESFSAPHWWRGSHRLGDFTDKRERQMVHLLVRRCFPHLRTFAEPLTSASASSSASQPAASAASCTSLSDSAAASVIVCAVDLHFVLFCATLGTEAAHCIAQWAVAAQAARQERSLDEATREVLRAVTPVEDGAVPAAVQKGVCFASFDALSEAMQRPCGGGCDHFDVNAPVLSEKDVRRHVHELLRRFYPFLRCQVREGQVVLRYCPRPGNASASGSPAASSNSSGSGGVVIGVRRPREEDDGEGSAETSSRPDGGFLHIIVVKRNLDTAEMRQLIGEYCGVKDSAVCVAGMKDKKAVTTQRCSLPIAGVSAKVSSALAAATPSLPVTLRWPADPLNSYAMVTRASPRRGPLHLGQLKGNWFSIRVRNVRWSALSDSIATQPSRECGDPQKHADALRAFVTERFHRCAKRGFVNYFGQQRFGETIDRADDHTGVHLFAGRWVEAVRSLYRGCPDVYDAFPEKMEVRFVPGNSRDAQVMTHALRQTQRMFFSELSLTRQDVQSSSPLWTRLCEKAITEGVAYFLRSLWVHAGQSVFFNLTASFLIASVQSTPPADLADSPSLPPLTAAVVEKAQLPLGGYHVHRSSPASEGDEATHALWCAWRDRAMQHALRTLRWTSAQAFEQRKVAGVPVPGSWRAVVVKPQDAALSWEAEPPQREGEVKEPANVPTAAAEMALPSLRLSFALPSSSYATIFLREVLGCDTWW